MKLLKGYEDEKEIDTEEMMHLIDDVWHKHITNYNGCTVSHDITRNFIRVIISEINSDIQDKRDEWDKVVTAEKAELEEIELKVKRGLVVYSLSSYIDRIRFYLLEYVYDDGVNKVLFQPQRL